MKQYTAQQLKEIIQQRTGTIHISEMRVPDPEAWTPDWECYCCQDTGTIQHNLVRLVIPEYDENRHGLIRCEKPGCLANFPMAKSVFDSSLCQELDLFSREDWKETQSNWHERRKEISALLAQAKTSVKAMPKPIDTD